MLLRKSQALMFPHAYKDEYLQDLLKSMCCGSSDPQCCTGVALGIYGVHNFTSDEGRSSAARAREPGLQTQSNL
eukprot:4759835-Amphidinium_carterae.1